MLYISFSVLFRWQKQIPMHIQVTMYKAYHSHYTTDAALSYIKVKQGFHTGFLRHGSPVFYAAIIGIISISLELAE